MAQDEQKQKTRFTFTLLPANPSDEEIAAVVEWVKQNSSDPDRVGTKRKPKQKQTRQKRKPDQTLGK